MDVETERIREMGWCDAAFLGLTWVNEGKDLQLHLAHAMLPIVGLLCGWTSDLKIKLDWHRPQHSTDERPLRRGGPLLTWQVDIKPTGDGRVAVLLDFAHDGEMGFECEGITTLPPGAA